MVYSIYKMAIYSLKYLISYWLDHSTRLCKNLFLSNVSESPNIISKCLARLTATLILLFSDKNPILCSLLHLTVDITTTSFSLPWNPSTVPISTSGYVSCNIAFNLVTCAL
eukprot:NODE_72_length_23514_cov_0.560624.p16 type:complete len:111 gc:universal NODE_72_length_23514_cov_0.560624:2222-1890(-)